MSKPGEILNIHWPIKCEVCHEPGEINAFNIALCNEHDNQLAEGMTIAHSKVNE